MAADDVIIVVDQNDVEIGFKRRGDIDSSKDIYRSSGIWIENSKQEALIAQRSFAKSKNPGKWGPAAAGTIDKGETYESNAVKELSEELGLESIELELIGVIKLGMPYPQFCAFFKGVADVPVSDIRLEPGQVEEAKFVPIKELISDVLASPDQYVDGMRLALEQLGYIQK